MPCFPPSDTYAGAFTMATPGSVCGPGLAGKGYGMAVTRNGVVCIADPPQFPAPPTKRCPWGLVELCVCQGYPTALNTLQFFPRPHSCLRLYMPHGASSRAHPHKTASDWYVRLTRSSPRSFVLTWNRDGGSEGT